MPIYVARFEHANTHRWGVVRGNRITPIPTEASTTGQLLQQFSLSALETINGAALDLSAVSLLSPVTQNQQFLCQGANYRQHMIESGMDPEQKKFNMIFTKASSCIVPANSDIVRPAHVRFLDYEIELGLVLKRDILQPVTIPRDRLCNYIAGIVIVNDISARDIQIPQMQFYKGKSYRSFGPVGPLLCLLADHEMSYLDRLRLTLTVNGEKRQDDSTANLVYGPAETLTELSGLQELYAGDLLATGTPAGCALAVPSPAKQRLAALLPESAKWKLFLKVQAGRRQYLQPGEVLESRIYSDDGVIDLGLQRNRVVAA